MVVGLGYLLMLVGTIWLIYLAVTHESTTANKAIWGILIFLFAPITGLIYFLMKKIGLVPLILVWIGVLVYGYSAFTGMSNLVK